MTTGKSKENKNLHRVAKCEDCSKQTDFKELRQLSKDTIEALVEVDILTSEESIKIQEIIDSINDDQLIAFGMTIHRSVTEQWSKKGTLRGYFTIQDIDPSMSYTKVKLND